MKFVIYRCKATPDYFIVTDEAHRSQIRGELCPEGGALEEVGIFPEMGEARVAFNEAIAKDAIKVQGYYRFEARSFDPVAQAPGAMPT